ncbi:MAG: MerR family transcriptional regulator [Deltaproteobacteria bacterium]|nr:MerR family transcriptional regulator [Deltaproteobacteria bacterium]
MEEQKKGFTIWALARAADVSVETIRYYERRGLLERPPRPGEGYRRYPDEAVQRVRFIKQAQKLGFSLKEINELFLAGTAAETTCAEILKLTQRKITGVEEKIRELVAVRRALQELAGTCPGEGPLSFCPIWHYLKSHTEQETRAMDKRKVEVFTAGCPVCADLVDLVQKTACPHCEVTVYNLNEGQGVKEAEHYGITAVPSVVVDGKLLDCCRRAHVTEHDLKAAGIGQPN